MANSDYLMDESQVPNNWVPVTRDAGAKPAPPARPDMPQFFSGSLPPALQHDTSFVGTKVGSSGIPQHSLMPLGVQGDPNTNAGLQSTTTRVIQSGTVQAVKLETNGAPNGAQNLLNLQQGTGVKLVDDGSGDVIISSGDGVTHGDSVYGYDSAWIREFDDFTYINTSGSVGDGSALGTSFQSSVMWSFIPATFASDPPYWTSGGPIPNLGMISIPNNSTANQATFLLKGLNTTHGLPLLDYPGWKMAWVFEVARVRDFPNGGSPTPIFAWGQVSLYAGLANWPTSSSTGTFGNTTTPRPPFFLGLRYDTDPTAPAISDSQFVFEYVTQAIGTSYARNNTQGTTVATGMNVVEGNWYRFEMACSTSGKVTMTLTDGTTSFTSTLTIGKIGFNTNPSSASISNGTTLVSYGSNLLPIATGTKYTFSYSGGGSSLSGTATQFDVNTSSSTLRFFGTGTGGLPTSSSLTFYPSLTPVFVFGNDSQAAPVGWQRGVSIDYYAFVWNPNLSSSAPGTPNSLKSRYW